MSGEPLRDFPEVPADLPKDMIRVLVGPPVSRKEQRKVRIAHYKPVPGSVKGPCMVCGMEVWLVPKQLEYFKANKANAIVACIRCTVERVKAQGENLPVYALGKQGGEFILDDGTVLMNGMPKNPQS